MTKYTVKPATIERDAIAAEMRAKGFTLREIGDSLGVSHEAARQMVARNFRRHMPEEDINLDRAEEAAKMDEIDASLAGIIKDPPYALTAAGKWVIGPDGEPIKDYGLVVRANDTRRKLSADRRRMKATDKPPKMSADEARAEMNQYLVDYQAQMAGGHWEFKQDDNPPEIEALPAWDDPSPWDQDERHTPPDGYSSQAHGRR